MVRGGLTHLARRHKDPCAYITQARRRARSNELHRILPQGHLEPSEGSAPYLGRCALDLGVALWEDVAESIPGLSQQLVVHGRYEDVLE